ncbi:OmpH family outer membrane protein [Piscirickettsia litoralis]|uniref:Outer membrane family protein n=1 Tax=Piscirickettsia litoralis TaxID=1891921 RepID=A0ABX3A7X7_9GAMM|nr:OmpH family outer membrane protein [Piscirickettsia litoralis]ODN43640.1 outer membrane family protein [Piscirickettsia litoralis]
MKKLLLAIMTLSLIAPAFAANTEKLKVGVVNLQEVFKAVPQGEKALNAERTKLQADNKKALDGLQGERKTLQEKVADFQRNAQIMSAADKEKKQAEIMKENQALQQKAINLQQMAQQDEQKVLASFNKAVGQAVITVASEQKLDLVLRQAATLYALKTMNITPAIIAQMEKSAKA